MRALLHLLVGVPSPLWVLLHFVLTLIYNLVGTTDFWPRKPASKEWPTWLIIRPCLKNQCAPLQPKYTFQSKSTSFSNWRGCPYRLPSIIVPTQGTLDLLREKDEATCCRRLVTASWRFEKWMREVHCSMACFVSTQKSWEGGSAPHMPHAFTSCK
jgi:hypothetical protein